VTLNYPLNRIDYVVILFGQIMRLQISVNWFRS